MMRIAFKRCPVKSLLLYTLIFLISAASYSVSFAEGIFTPEEQAYINSHTTVSIGIVDSNEPHSFLRNGMIKGNSIELLKKIESISGLKFDLRLGNWSDIYNSFLNGKLDAIDSITYTEERAKAIIFTDPYLIRETMVFMRGDNAPEKFSGVNDLHGKRIGIVKDIYYSNILKDRYGLNIVPYSDYTDLMKALAFGWVDAAISSELTGLYIARENNLSNLRIAGPLGISEIAKEDFRIGVLRSDPLLHSIISKSLNSIPRQELDEIEKTWFSYFFGADRPEKVILTEQEKSFIENHPVVTIGMLTDYEPFSFDVNGRIKGFTASLLDIISENTGLRFRYEKGNWSQLFNLFRMGKIESIADISYTKDREAFTLFTDEYNRVPTVVFVRDSFGSYKGIRSLTGKKVGIARDVFYKDKIISLLHDNVLEFDTHDEMMRELSFGGIDAVVTSLNNGHNLIKKYGLVNIVVAGEFGNNGTETEDLRFGISKKYPELRSIMNKGMGVISIEKRIGLENKWLSVESLSHATGSIMLTDAEKDYLREKGTIRLCVDPDWMPFEMLDSSGRHTGIAADFFDIMRSRISAEMIVVPTKSWAESIEFMHQHKCDVFTLAMKTPDRSSYLNFTKPYLIIPNVIATSVNDPFIESIEDVLDKPIGSVKGYAVTEMLRRTYPNINLIEVDNDRQGIAMLQRGTLYGYVGTMPTIGYQIQQQRIVDIKISGKLPNDWELSVASRKDEPELNSIFEKLVSSVSAEEKNGILNKWMSIRFEQKFDYRLFWRVMAVVFAFVLFAAYWSNKLRKLNKELQRANTLLLELSEKDSLTGLYNRRFFMTHGGHSFSICMRNGIGFSIAMIDIDHFKNLNDTYGHIMGDMCLKKLAEILTTHFQRQSDSVARYGGEEFTLYCACGDSRKLAANVEQIRYEVENTPMIYSGHKTNMTISAGVYSAVPKQGETLEDFLNKADKALYEAKNSGRNRVVTIYE